MVKKQNQIMPYHQNRLQQLRGFYYAAMYKSFTKAARRIRCGQPSISLQVKALERELGVTLFTRRSDGVTLTTEGEILYHLAVPLVLGMDHLKEEFEDELGRGMVNKFSIAATEGLTLYILGDVVKRFRENFPRVELRILNRSAHQIAELVSMGEVDLGIASPLYLSPGINYEEYFRFETLLIAPIGHPILQMKRLNLQNIVAQPLVLIDTTYALRQQIDQVFHDNHLLFQPIMEVGDWEIVKAYVSRGIGLSIVPEFCTFSCAEKLASVPISRHFGHRQYGIIYRRGKPLNKAAKGFIDILKELNKESYMKKEEKDSPSPPE
ncbi:LysR family transcriptional regulator [bacterium]|nr:LysR family transcriptional regulator [bacterium]